MEHWSKKQKPPVDISAIGMPDIEVAMDAPQLPEVVIEVPTPDPFWPAGAPPLHLPMAQQQDPDIVDPFMRDAEGKIWKCEKCSTTVGRSLSDPRFCFACAEKVEQGLVAAKKVGSSWMDEAKSLGIEIFERQTEETELEWRIWSLYRAHYPMKMPTMSELAKEAGSTVSTVVRTANRWNFNVRLMAWARYADAEMSQERIQHIKEMNRKHLKMSKAIQEKLEVAIDSLDPVGMKPSDIGGMFKIATELERRILTAQEEKVASDATLQTSKPKLDTKPEDLAEVAKILMDAGLLNGKMLGVEQTQTQTTRIIAKEDPH